MTAGPRYIASERPAQEHSSQQFLHCYMGMLLGDGSDIVACLRRYCVAMGVFVEPFPSNGCLCWFQSFCFEKIYHSTYFWDSLFFARIWSVTLSQRERERARTLEQNLRKNKKKKIYPIPFSVKLTDSEIITQKSLFCYDSF
jgi:hypothetical protein